jgi:hypothetical protein
VDGWMVLVVYGLGLIGVVMSEVEGGLDEFWGWVDGWSSWLRGWA